jgi:acetyl esterase/lipase
VIVTVDYRLAPETPFPGALEDNYTVLKWVHHHAAQLGIDRARIAVQGESAGAAHAAMLAIHARNLGHVPICFQLLAQPMLDDRTGSSRDPAAHIGTFLWVRQLNVLGWQALLGQAPGGPDAPRGAVPAREEDLSGLPPACVVVGALDLFVDESIDYAKRLISAGVSTELLVVPGAFHGFSAVAPQAGVTLRYKVAILNAMARAFGGAQPHFQP